MKTIVTGHRPQSIGGFGQKKKFQLIKKAISEDFKSWTPQLVISGMAIGFDQWVVEVCIKEGRPFLAALPFEGQENKWPPKTQEHYHWLLSKASKTVYVDREVGYVSNAALPGVYHPVKMLRRNEWMIDQMEQGDHLLSLWNRQRKGGTWATIEYFEVIPTWREKHSWNNLTPDHFTDNPF